MKTVLLIAAILCLLLSACAAHPTETNPTAVPSVPTTAVPTAPTTIPTEPTTVPATEPYPVTFQVYYPDSDWVHFLKHDATLSELTPGAVLQELILVEIVNPDVTVNSLTFEGEQLTLDLNGAFLSQLYSLGTTGERFVIGSIVNTFLSAYRTETIFITADGQIMESGHVVYDFPLSRFE